MDFRCGHFTQPNLKMALRLNKEKGIILVKLLACLYATLPHGHLLGSYHSSVPGVDYVIFALVWYAWILPAWYLSRVILNIFLSADENENPDIRGWPITWVVFIWALMRIVLLVLLIGAAKPV